MDKLSLRDAIKFTKFGHYLMHTEWAQLPKDYPDCSHVLMDGRSSPIASNKNRLGNVIALVVRDEKLEEEYFRTDVYASDFGRKNLYSTLDEVDDFEEICEIAKAEFGSMSGIVGFDVEREGEWPQITIWVNDKCILKDFDQRCVGRKQQCMILIKKVKKEKVD